MAIHPTLTPAEYLAFERQQTDAKHEYLRGQITAMSGASREHNLIVGNAFARMRPRKSSNMAYRNSGTE
ncbi:MAG: Uma2 family endonuclease [Candidatus Tectomicrobia bacterium]|nr:Uma2 family endonuclease [Candidatus Tectomicrobia bacterium]